MTKPFDALDALNDRLTETECLVQSFDLLAGDNPPPWVWVLQRRTEALRDASEALERALRGYGGRDPHGDTKAGAPCPCSRAKPQLATEQAACSEKPSSLALSGKNFQ
jgi:hypothetical protein